MASICSRKPGVFIILSTSSGLGVAPIPPSGPNILAHGSDAYPAYLAPVKSASGLPGLTPVAIFVGTSGVVRVLDDVEVLVAEEESLGGAPRMR